MKNLAKYFYSSYYKIKFWRPLKLINIFRVIERRLFMKYGKRNVERKRFTARLPVKIYEALCDESMRENVSCVQIVSRSLEMHFEGNLDEFVL